MSKDRSRFKFAEGAEVFEHNGRLVLKYNAKVNIAGDRCSVLFYEKGIMSGFVKNRGEYRKSSDRSEYDPKERFEKTGRTAQRRIRDLVAVNLRRHKDCNGKKQGFKFVTLTFREDIKKLDEANKLFKKFILRLNYHFSPGSSFLEYVAVPELQQESGRMVWHYHVLFFNLPFIPVSGEMVDRLVEAGRLSPVYDKRDTLYYIWGNGSVDICAVKFSDSYDVAGYVAKYIGKGLEGSFEYAEKEKLLHKKRFLRSGGLFPPQVLIAFLNRIDREKLFKYASRNSKHVCKKSGIRPAFETFVVENEYAGRIYGMDFRLSMKRLAWLRSFFDKYGYGFNSNEEVF